MCYYWKMITFTQENQPLKIWIGGYKIILIGMIVAHNGPNYILLLDNLNNSTNTTGVRSTKIGKLKK